MKNNSKRIIVGNKGYTNLRYTLALRNSTFLNCTCNKNKPKIYQTETNVNFKLILRIQQHRLADVPSSWRVHTKI